MNKEFLINRIIFKREFLFFFKILIDRCLFYLFYEKYYKKKFKYYGQNVRWGRDSLWCLIPSSVRISNPDKIEIGNNCQIDDYVFLQAHHNSDGIIIGCNTRINENVHILGYSKIIIGESVLIAPFCHINSGNHGFDNKEVPIMCQIYKKSGNIIIGSGSWFGRNSTLLGGVTLGRNTVVAASAVVTKSFLENSIIGGIPAKLLN